MNRRTFFARLAGALAAVALPWRKREGLVVSPTHTPAEPWRNPIFAAHQRVYDRLEFDPS